MRSTTNLAELSILPRASQLENTGNNRILIIDDNRSIHEDFKKVLQAPEKGNEQLNEISAFVLGGSHEGTHVPLVELDSAFQGQEGCEMLRREKENGKPYAMAFVDM